MRRRFVAISLFLALALLCSLVQSPLAMAGSRDEGDWSARRLAAGPGEVVPGRYLVRFRPGSNARVEAAALAAVGAEVVNVYEHALKAATVRVPDSAVQGLERNPRVLGVEPDRVVAGVERSTTGPSTSAAAVQSGAPWGLDRSDQRALPLSGSYTYPHSASGVTAYIVDSGIYYGHADFGGRVAAGANAVFDDWGLTWGADDCDGHGTHVAGVVGGSVSGMAKSVNLVPVRVLDCVGMGYLSEIVAGLDWVADDHLSGVPAVANMSFGSGASSTVDAAVQGVIDDGVHVVVAAGNETADACGTSPARVAGALTVGATDTGDVRAGFSNYGSCLDLFAPGTGIVSADTWDPTGSVIMSGTSQASPHVAGAVAVLLGQQPTLAPTQVAATIVGSATSGLVANAGSGSPNRLLYAPPALSDPLEPPSAPPPRTSMTQPVGRWTLKSSVLAAWSATSSVGVKGYTVQRRAGGYSRGLSRYSTWLSLTSLRSRSFSATRGATYCVRARATDRQDSVGAFSSARCTAVPLNVSGLNFGSGWTKRSVATAYTGVVRQTSKRRAAVARSGIVGKRIALVATKCRGCGSVRVYWNGSYKKTVNLAATSTRRKRVIGLLAFSRQRTGRLVLKVSSSNRPVIIEGLGISKS